MSPLARNILSSMNTRHGIHSSQSHARLTNLMMSSGIEKWQKAFLRGQDLHGAGELFNRVSGAVATRLAYMISRKLGGQRRAFGVLRQSGFKVFAAYCTRREVCSNFAFAAVTLSMSSLVAGCRTSGSGTICPPIRPHAHQELRRLLTRRRVLR
jgi:hypothetical protein